MPRTLLAVLVAFSLLPLAGPPGTATEPSPRPGRSLAAINHVIVIYLENWSFDGLYGRFPGANGLAGAHPATQRQVDLDGVPYAALPQVDPRLPDDLPVAPFDLAPYVPPDGKSVDMTHRFYQQQLQLNGGRLDRFVAWGAYERDTPRANGLVMSYYDTLALSICPRCPAELAREFTLADNFFHAAFGGSFLNHAWLLCACTPVWPDAPDSQRIRPDRAYLRGVVTPREDPRFGIEGDYIVNNPPASVSRPGGVVPLQTLPTIGDRLSDAGIDWKWYGTYAGMAFDYFAAYTYDTPGRAAHLERNDARFVEDVRNGTLPAVAYVRPTGGNSEHPASDSLLQGEAHVYALVDAVRQSPYWADSLIVVTYDENGGRWDHVAPPSYPADYPRADRWGPGTRVPALIISPFARQGYVDHTQYDTTSILKLIERRWGLAPLGTRDAAADGLSGALKLE